MVSRRIIQGISAFLTNANWKGFRDGTIYNGDTKALCVPGLNCYSCPGAVGGCPIGALQSSLSGFIPRIPFYVLGFIALFGVLFGRVVCGYLCPFGLLQDLLDCVPCRKIRKSKITRRLTKVKYAFLGLVFLGPLMSFAVIGLGEPLFCKYICPAGTVEGALPLFVVNESLRSAAGSLTVWKGLLAGSILLMSTFVFRPFCRFICPLGAIYGFFNRYALTGIAVDKNKCVHCGRCAAVCKSDVTLAGDKECISCGECVDVCPVHAVYKRKLIMRKVEERDNV